MAAASMLPKLPNPDAIADDVGTPTALEVPPDAAVTFRRPASVCARSQVRWP